MIIRFAMTEVNRIKWSFAVYEKRDKHLDMNSLHELKLGNMTIVNDSLANPICRERESVRVSERGKKH